VKSEGGGFAKNARKKAGIKCTFLGNGKKRIFEEKEHGGLIIHRPDDRNDFRRTN
jgi:hypothetical protein